MLLLFAAAVILLLQKLPTLHWERRLNSVDGNIIPTKQAIAQVTKNTLHG